MGGDLYLREAGVISEPDVLQVKLAQTDQFLLVCSDGVWEYLPPQNAVNVINDALTTRENPVKQLARTTSDAWEAQENETVDDITIILVQLQAQLGDVNLQSNGLKKSALKRSDTSSAISSGGFSHSTAASQGSGGLKGGNLNR